MKYMLPVLLLCATAFRWPFDAQRVADRVDRHNEIIQVVRDNPGRILPFWRDKFIAEYKAWIIFGTAIVALLGYLRSKNGKGKA